jgi:ribosomal protein L37AE/L43A
MEQTKVCEDCGSKVGVRKYEQVFFLCEKCIEKEEKQNEGIYKQDEEYFKMSYVKNYIKTIGIRKCEANAIVPMPAIARDLVETSIVNFLGKNAVARFKKKRDDIKKQLDEFRVRTGLDLSLKKALKIIGDEEQKERDNEDGED